MNASFSLIFCGILQFSRLIYSPFSCYLLHFYIARFDYLVFRHFVAIYKAFNLYAFLFCKTRFFTKPANSCFFPVSMQFEVIYILELCGVKCTDHVCVEEEDHNDEMGSISVCDLLISG